MKIVEQPEKVQFEATQVLVLFSEESNAELLDAYNDIDI